MTRTHARRARDGFVLLTVLWVMAGATVVAAAAALVGREAVRAGATRAELERARWTALGCERRAEAAIDDELRAAPSDDDAALAWQALGDRVAESALVVGCNVTLEAAGTRLDVNGATTEMLARLFDALGFAGRAPEMADAVTDWIDADADPSPLGAEADWYRGEDRLPPRNGPIADPREIFRIRGFENAQGIDSVLGVDSARVSLATASVPVLMAVPGVTRETAERIVALRSAGMPVRDLTSVVGSISESSAAALADRFADAARLTTADPDAWLVRARTTRGIPPVSVTLTWRIIRVGRRCAVASTRSDL